MNEREAAVVAQLHLGQPAPAFVPAAVLPDPAHHRLKNLFREVREGRAQIEDCSNFAPQLDRFKISNRLPTLQLRFSADKKSLYGRLIDSVVGVQADVELGLLVELDIGSHGELAAALSQAHSEV